MSSGLVSWVGGRVVCQQLNLHVPTASFMCLLDLFLGLEGGW